jgi:uncharacterized protein (TIGR02285 family)
MKCLVILIVVILFHAPVALAGENIYWLTISYPPAYITEGADKGKGTGDMTLKYFTEHLPQYGHTTQLVPMVRVEHELVRNEKFTCMPNTVGTPERFGDKVISTTAPAYLMPPSGIIIRKQDAPLFNNGNPLSFKELLKNDKLKCGLLKGAKFGMKIPVLAQENDKNIEWVSYTEPDKFFELLFANPKRIDYFPAHSFTFNFYAKRLNLQDKVLFIPIMEETDPIPTRAYCQNTEAGKKVIGQLEKFQKTPEFKKMVIEDALLNYIPENLRDEYRKINGL